MVFTFLGVKWTDFLFFSSPLLQKWRWKQKWSLVTLPISTTHTKLSSIDSTFTNWVNPGRPHLRISRYQQRISEIFLSLISVKSFASSRVRTADLESHSPLLYHRAMQNCCETKLLKTLNKLSLNSQGSQGPEFFSKFLRWVPPGWDIHRVLLVFDSRSRDKITHRGVVKWKMGVVSRVRN